MSSRHVLLIVVMIVGAAIFYGCEAGTATPEDPKAAKPAATQPAARTSPPPSRNEEADILDYAGKHPLKTRVRQADGTWRRPKYGDIALEPAEEALKDYAKPWTVKKVLSWYKAAKDGKTRAHLLRVLAASRHPKAAIELGRALDDKSLDVRVAATYALLDYFAPDAGLNGGTESAMFAAAKWWQENRQRLLLEVATQPAAHPATAGIEWIHLKGGKIKVPDLRKSLESSRAITISAAPITCEQYARFLRATRHRPPKIPPDDPVFKFKKLADVFQWQDSRPPKGCADWPVALVSRHDAEAYCQWLAKSTGRVHRLPTWQELRFALTLDGTWRDKVSSTSLGEPGGSGRVVWYGLGPVGAKDAIRSIVGLRCFPMALSEWTSGDWVCSPTIGNATRSSATHSYYRQNLGRLLNVYGFRIVSESKAADPTATQPVEQRTFKDALIFVDNYLSGVKNGATRPLSSQGWVACGRPGAGGKVSWRYLRTTGRGDEYEITRALPRAVARRDRLGTMQITYAGVPFVVFVGKNKRVVLLPGRFKNVHTDGPKTDDALVLLKENRARELSFNMDLLTTPAALPALTAVLRDAGGSKYARKIAAAVLGRIGSRDARDALITALRKTPQPDFDMGGSMWDSLLSAIDRCIEREPEKQVIDDLGHGQPEVRWLAAMQLGRRKSAAAVPALIALLDDKHPVRLGATWALGEIGDVRGDAALFAIVEGRRGGGNAVSAIEAMGKIGTDRALAAVKSIKPDHPGHWMARKVLAGWGSNFRKPATRPAGDRLDQRKLRR